MLLSCPPVQHNSSLNNSDEVYSMVDIPMEKLIMKHFIRHFQQFSYNSVPNENSFKYFYDCASMEELKKIIQKDRFQVLDSIRASEIKTMNQEEK